MNSEPLQDDVIELRLDRPGGGADAVGRGDDGKVVFAGGGLPGELVRVRIDERRKRFDRGQVVEVLDASPDRRDPDCPMVDEGCGGCDLAHVRAPAQQQWRSHLVADALDRIARLDNRPPIRTGPLFLRTARTTVRLGIDRKGRLGHRQRRSNAVVAPIECGVLDPNLEALVRTVRVGSVADDDEVLVRWSVHDGRGYLVAPAAARVEIGEWSDRVEIHGPDAFGAGSGVELTELAGGRLWRVSAGSFFQAGPAVVDALVDVVDAMLDEHAGPLDTFVDAYGGIGIFAGTVGRRFGHRIVIESSPSSVADARHNLDADRVSFVETRVERWSPASADVVVADPARRGLGEAAVERLTATGATTLVLVSCDIGSMGRDVGLLSRAGWSLEDVVIVDAFVDTSHAEVVSRLGRAAL